MKKLIAIISLLVAFSLSAPTTTRAYSQVSNLQFDPPDCETYIILCPDLHEAGYAVCCIPTDYLVWMYYLC